MSSVVDDELLANLIAAGSADILIGLPTRNNAGTVGAVVRAINAALAGPFVRERAVILTIDAGSSDGTLDVVKRAAAEGDGVLPSRTALRSIHRIATSLDDVPSRKAALRVLFASADLLRAHAVVLIDPAAVSLDSEHHARWISTILRGGVDYAKPALARGAFDGPLVAQLVRPLLGAAYGVELLEPVDTQLACSGRFAAEVLSADFWDSPLAELGVDAFLSAWALRGPHRVWQVATPWQGRLDLDPAPSVSEVFRQMLGATFASLARDASTWLEAESAKSVPVAGDLLAMPASEPSFDVRELADAFRLGVDALAPFLDTALGGHLLAALTAAAASDPPRLDDRLWAETVFRFVGAARRDAGQAARLAQMLEPIYLGRLASYVARETSSERTEDPLETLAAFFQSQKVALREELRPRREH